MSFREVQFPLDIGYGSAGGPGFMTDVIEADSGAEQRVARWNQPRHRYNVAYGVRKHTQLATLRDFYIARQGPKFGFRYRDFHDCTTSATGLAPELGGAQPAHNDVNIAVGDGNQTTFQGIKRYTSGVATRVRKVTKPNAGTVKVGLNGVDQASGFSVNTTTGQVTFSTAPANGTTVQWGCQFDTPVRFGKEVDEVLSLSIDDFGSGSAQDVPLVELVDENEIADEYFYGGSTSFVNVLTNITISTLHGRVIVVDAQAANVDVILPDKTGLSGGGPWFFIANVGNFTFEVRDGNDNSLVTAVDSTKGAEIVLSVASDNTRTWFSI